MKTYSVIIPAHNEANFLEGTLQSLCEQTVSALEIILVNDNATDDTETIMQRFSAAYANISYVNHDSEAAHLPGAKVIHAFAFGLKHLEQPYDVLVKLDADLLLPKDYFETILAVFEDPKVGIAGGFCYEQNKAGDWELNHPMGLDHVRGAFKAYSNACFAAIGGLRPAMGWDTVDELLARYFGFSVETLPQLHVKHRRPIGAGYGPRAAQFQGAAFYVLRYGWLLSVLASLKNAFLKRSLPTFIRLLSGYQKAKREQQPFLIDAEQGKFIRTYRWNEIKNKKKA